MPSSQTETSTPTLNLNTNLNRLLLGLIVPSVIMVLNMAMFSVALPTLRSEFQIEADMTAWLVTAYTLPFVIFTPLYGRLGDSFGKRLMLLTGMVIYAIGVGLSFFAIDQRMLVLGRVAQGIGNAGINPLCIAIVSELFPPEKRGRALGTWSSTGPATATIAPFAAGFIVDHFGWRATNILLILASIVAFGLMWSFLPRSQQRFERSLLRQFDWIGFVLLAIGCTFFVFYLSSRPITGIEPLQDWRLLLVSLLFFGGFYYWERFYHSPLLDFSLFARKNFGRASICGMLRMVLMSSGDFLIPLYFTDIHQIGPATLGLILALYSSALLTTTRLAGQLSDRGIGRWLILGGLSLQGSVLLGLFFLPASVPAPLAVVFFFALGMGAGLSLAVISNVAMSDVPRQQAGAAAGLFSLIRFSGSMVGSTMAGVLLRQSLAATNAPINAYQIVFACAAAVAILGALLAIRLQPNRVLAT